MFGLSLGIGLGNQTVSGGGGGRGANLLIGKTVAPGGSVTYNSGTGVFTVPASQNVLATWTTGVLSPSTSYTLTLNYNLTQGGNLRAADNGSGNFGTAPLTIDGATHAMTITFTTPGTVNQFQIVADSGLYGNGTIDSVYLSSP